MGRSIRLAMLAQDDVVCLLRWRYFKLLWSRLPRGEAARNDGGCEVRRCEKPQKQLRMINYHSTMLMAGELRMLWNFSDGRGVVFKKLISVNP